MIAALALTAVGVVGVAAAGSAPFADAGLDQTVVDGTTVYLDAGGSTDPDGRIESYRRRIEGPNGTVTPPDPDAARTRFRPTTPGRYVATVTVTDGSGDSATDRLYVTVEVDRGPTVDPTGPTEAFVGCETGFRVDASTGRAPFRLLPLYENGTRSLRRSTPRR